MPRQKISPVVDEFMARFEFAFTEVIQHFDRMEIVNRSYGNIIDTSSWPSISEISIPWTFTSVEEQLPYMMQYLLPKNDWIKLIPESSIPTERLRAVRDALRYTLLTEMSLRDCMHLSLKDCFKYGVGYGLIDTEWITPETRVINELLIGNEVIESIPTIAPGEPVQKVVYTYVNPSEVIPMPGGANVERPNKAPGHYVLINYAESDFKDLYKRSDLKGDPTEIIKEARSLNFDQRLLSVDVMAKLSNVDLTLTNQPDKRIPVIIPVLRWYGDHEHIWVANGTTLMRHEKQTTQTMRSDLIKWSGWPAGNEWFPMGITEASNPISTGMNIWYNGLVDLAMYHLNPTRVINTKIVDTTNRIGRGPRSDIEVSGDADKAISYLDLPPMPQQLFQMGDVLQQFHGMVNAQPSTVRQGATGLVRGGTNALETLLATTTGRQFLAAMACKTGGLQPTVEKTLLKKQLLVDRRGETFVQEGFDSLTGESTFNEQNVTLDDLRHVFRVEIDLPASRMNSAADFAERMGIFDRAINDRAMFDRRALYEFAIQDHETVRELMLPEDVVRERSEREAEAVLRGQEAEAEQGSLEQTTGATTQGAQAIAGAAATGGEL